MENELRFRNHISLILPNLKGIIWILFAAVVTGLSGEGFSEFLSSLLGGVCIVAGVIVYQLVLWSKTWISIDESSIVIERNTFLFRKKNTIGIQNISNVNLEQGVMGMLLGTCKLKIDTSSLSTANSTDVTIVLKKDFAEEIRKFLMLMATRQEAPEDRYEEGTAEENKRQKDIIMKDIFLHGIFCTRFLSTLFLPVFIILELAEVVDAKDWSYIVSEVDAFATETVGVWVLLLIALVSWGLLTCIFSLVRNIVKYWDFKIERLEDKIILEYGLTNKINYSIPVEKIQAVVLKQTFLARVFRRYMVEVINVGMNDDRNEIQAFLLPYSTKKITKERMSIILPEFAGYLDAQVEKQPQKVWFAWMWPAVLYLLLAAIAFIGVMELFPKGILMTSIGIVGVAFVLLLTKICRYITEGVLLDEKVMILRQGALECNYVVVKYEKIQHLSFSQNFIAKRFAIQRGAVHLLASTKNQIQHIPYVSEKIVDSMKNRICK